MIKLTKRDKEKIYARYIEMYKLFRAQSLEDLILIKNTKRSSTDQEAYKQALYHKEQEKMQQKASNSIIGA